MFSTVFSHYQIFSIFFHFSDSSSSVSECLVNAFHNIFLESVWQPHVRGWRRRRKEGVTSRIKENTEATPLSQPTSDFMTQFAFWKYAISFFFFFSPREKKKGNTYFIVTNYHSPACPTCTCAPCRQCNAVSWRRFFRSDNGSLIQSTVMVLVWNTLLPT